MSATAAVAIAIGLALVAVVASSRAAGASGPLPIFGAGLTYLLVLVPTFAIAGVNFGILLGLSLLIALPVLLGTVLGRHPGWSLPATGDPNTGTEWVPKVAVWLVALGLFTAQLIAAGQVTSLLGHVNPMLVMVGLAAVGWLCANAGGVTGAWRVNRWAFWALVVTTVLLLVVGWILGSPQYTFDQTLPVEGPAVGSWLAITAVVVVVAALDQGLRDAVTAASSRAGYRAAALLFAVTLVFGISLLWVFGGSFTAPSLQFNVITANLPTVALFVVLAIVTLLFAATSNTILSAAVRHANADRSGDFSWWPLLLAAAGAAIAVASPPMEMVLVITGIVAAAAIGALLPGAGRPGPGTTAGFIAGLVAAALVTALTSIGLAWEFTASGLLAVAASGGLAWLITKLAGTSPATANEPHVSSPTEPGAG